MIRLKIKICNTLLTKKQQKEISAVSIRESFTYSPLGKVLKQTIEDAV